MVTTQPQALEFFAGIGLAHYGLRAAGVEVVHSSDFDPVKVDIYNTQWGSDACQLADICTVDGSTLPPATIVWSSSPCTDLSSAGHQAGIYNGERSRVFFDFMAVVSQMKERPRVIALENVVGLATAHGGDNLRAVITEFNSLGYAADVVVVNAHHFVPQSRPRLFVIGALNPINNGSLDDAVLRPRSVSWVHHDPELRTFIMETPPLPAPMTTGLYDVLEQLPADDPRWWDGQKVAKFESMLAPIHAARYAAMRDSETITARGAHGRTRYGTLVWEIRSDEISGCIVTPKGNLSRQAIVIAGRGSTQIRWLTPVEYARLMGAGDYTFGDISVTRAQFGFGDAVAVDAVTWLARHMIMPLEACRT